jgi:hypothetical protein
MYVLSSYLKGFWPFVTEASLSVKEPDTTYPEPAGQVGQEPVTTFETEYTAALSALSQIAVVKSARV